MGWSYTLERGYLGHLVGWHSVWEALLTFQGLETRMPDLVPWTSLPQSSRQAFMCARDHLSTEPDTMSCRNSKYWGHGFNRSWIFSAFFKKNWTLFYFKLYPELFTVAGKHIIDCSGPHCVWISRTRNQEESVFMAVSLVVTPLGKHLATLLYPARE